MAFRRAARDRRARRCRCGRPSCRPSCTTLRHHGHMLHARAVAQYLERQALARQPARMRLRQFAPGRDRLAVDGNHLVARRNAGRGGGDPAATCTDDRLAAGAGTGCRPSLRGKVGVQALSRRARSDRALEWRSRRVGFDDLAVSPVGGRRACRISSQRKSCQVVDRRCRTTARTVSPCSDYPLRAAAVPAGGAPRTGRSSSTPCMNSTSRARWPAADWRAGRPRRSARGDRRVWRLKARCSFLGRHRRLRARRAS